LFASLGKHDVDEELLIICLGAKMLLTSQQNCCTPDRNEELISHSAHKQKGKVNAESMFVLAFNIRARIIFPAPDQKSRQNASNSIKMIKMWLVMVKCYARSKKPATSLYTFSLLLLMLYI
jgi:hypothetical protein